MDLGLAESAGKTWAVEGAFTFRGEWDSWRFVSREGTGHVPSCPSRSSSVPQELTLGSCHVGLGVEACGDGERGAVSRAGARGYRES